MISKCSNIVINRTKFSDFEDFDVTSQSTEGLKLVGYINTVDLNSGEVIKKNVAVEYPSNEITIEIPPNYSILSLRNSKLDTSIISLDAVGDVNCYRINSNFEADYIQINFKDSDPKDLKDKFFDVVYDDITYKCFHISFDRYIPLGKEIKILFKNFPIHIEPLAVRQLDYSKSLDDTPGVITGEEILFSWDTKFISGKNLLVTFVQTLRSDVDADSANNRIMVPTTIKLID